MQMLLKKIFYLLSIIGISATILISFLQQATKWENGGDIKSSYGNRGTITTVESIQSNLRKYYFYPFEQLLQNETNCIRLKIIKFLCKESAFCGGFGDRLKGVVTAFYLAVGFHLPFKIVWTGATNLDDYFEINSAFYHFHENETCPSYVREGWNKTEIPKEERWPGEDELLFSRWAENLQDGSLIPPLTTNRFGGLHGLLKNPHIKQNLEQITTKVNISNAILISAALKSLLSKPVPRLRNLYQQCVFDQINGDLYTWKESFKIGIQIRIGMRNNKGTLDYPRVPLSCVSKFIEIATLEAKQQPKSIIFVTTDSKDIEEEVVRNLTMKTGSATILSSSTRCPDLIYNHLDFINEPIGWLESAKTFIDWLALVEMDKLYISQSNFGKMSSRFSLVPTHMLVSNPKIVEEFGCFFSEYSLENRSNLLRPSDDEMYRRMKQEILMKNKSAPLFEV